MTLRRRALLAVPFFSLLADERDEALRILEPLVAALSDGKSQPFMAAVNRSMADYAVLEANVESLVRQAEVASSVKLISASPEMFEVDWMMSLRARSDSAMSERRRQRVKVEVAERKIQSIGPISFFAPMGSER